MKTIRLALALAATALLTLGYAASQYAYFATPPQERALRVAEHAVRMDTPAIRWLATILLVSAVVLNFVRADEREGA